MIRLRFLIPVLFSSLLCCDGQEEPQGTPAAPAGNPIEPARIRGIYEPGTCDRCGSPAGKHHQCNRTRWCPSCLRDCGDNHICGKTEYCNSCLREIGQLNHACGKTRICRSPQCSQDRLIEVGPNHVCTETQYCKKCGFEHYSGKDDCPETYACPRCEVEVSRHHHVCLFSSFCRECGMEAALPLACRRHSGEPSRDCPDCKILHHCGETRFCPECREEKETTHRH